MANLQDFGFDKLLNKPIDSNSTGVVYDTVDNALNTGSILQGGNLTLKTLSIGGLVRQVAPGDDIQAAIDAVNREGGGTVQLLAKTYTLTANINMKSNVVLMGVGRDVTILEFNGSSLGVLVTGTSQGTYISNFSIKNLTLQNSNNIAGLDISFASFFNLENIKVSSCDQKGLRITGCLDYNLFNVISTTNTGNGFEIIGDATDGNYRFILYQCYALLNTGKGFLFTNSASSALKFFSMINCTAESNDGVGIDFNSSIAASTLLGKFMACTSSNNNNVGIKGSSNITGT